LKAPWRLKRNPANLNRFENGQRIKYQGKLNTHDINRSVSISIHHHRNTISSPPQHHLITTNNVVEIKRPPLNTQILQPPRHRPSPPESVVAAGKKLHPTSKSNTFASPELYPVTTTTITETKSVTTTTTKTEPDLSPPLLPFLTPKQPRREQLVLNQNNKHKSIVRLREALP
jgi:hypothetical protein